MQITVVIATHNRAELLREALASIAAQSFREWEIVVVDDGSQPPVSLDGLPQALSGHVSIFRHEQPQGPSAARNTGMRAARGDLVTFLDDDDLLKPDALNKIASAFENDAGLECLFLNVEPFGRSAEGTRHNQEQALSHLFDKMGLTLSTTQSIIQLGSEALFIALLEHLPIAFQRLAIKRSAIEKVGPFSGKGFEDLEWYYRVAIRCRCAFLVTQCHLLRCEGQSYFSRIEAKRRLMDTVIHIRRSLLRLEEVSSKPLLKRKVAASLAQANFNLAYFARENRRKFPWRNFLDSCSHGLRWRHLSLVGGLLIDRVVLLLSQCRS